MKRFLSLCLILCLLLAGCELGPSAPMEVPADSEGLTVHFIDVGQADSILLQCDGANMLIDGGNVEDSDLVVSYLQDQGVTYLDYVVNTHAHEDHVGGLAAVLAVYETGNVWCPVQEYDSKCFRDFVKYANQQELELIYPAPGSRYALGSATVTVLGPVEDYTDTNNTSIVLKVTYGETSFLFTGDAESEAEKGILAAGYDVSATVLKVGHHGSETSSCYQWIRAVAPKYAVISVGTGNSYGHPHEEPLSRFRDADAIVYRTDLQGHIVCQSDGKTVAFTTEKEAAVTNPTAYDGSGQNAQAEEFIGNVNSKKFHLPTCSGLPDEKNQVFFDSYDEAIEAGYSPCSRCIG